MSKNITKEDVIKHKKTAIRKIDSVFETFINSPNHKHQKKADLIAYWLESYSEYLLTEERFDYKRIPKYKRGSVVSVNFGFNVGSEHGGLHYAIVLDNDNKQSSPVVTVVPLSSGTESDTFSRDVFLGNELYEKLRTKHDKLESKIDEDLKTAVNMVEVLRKSAGKLPADENDEGATEFMNLIAELEQRVCDFEKEKQTLATYQKEIQKLKEGSIALMEQITTISKMRIYKPKKSEDLLSGIKFSDGAMDKINEKLKELYICSK